MANYYFNDTYGQRQGPFDEHQIREMAVHGDLQPHTPMETDTGHRGVAGQIPGLFEFALPQPAAHEVSLFCTNCGNPVDERAGACMTCGVAPVGYRNFCRQCGAALNPEQIFCVSCGSSINAPGVYRPAGVTRPYGVSDYSIVHIVLSVVLMVTCCCLPLGIPALIFAIMSNSDFANGNYESAARYSKIAFWCNLIGFAVAIIGWALYVVLAITMPFVGM
jgi:hypothetical protein